MDPALGRLDEMVGLARGDAGRLRAHGDDEEHGRKCQDQQGFPCMKE